MLGALPLDWVIGIIGTVGGAILAFFAGTRRERKKAMEQNLKASQDVRKKEKEIRDEDDDSLVDRISR